MKAGQIVTWAAAGFVLVVGGLVVIVVILTGPPPSGNTGNVVLAFLATLLLPAAAILAAIRAPRMPKPAAAVIAVSGALIAAYALFGSFEVNIVLALLGLVCIVGAGMIFRAAERTD
ncbi:hypothetical protein HKCCE2091_10875 [Rhodobacterales bacterium HKCCE2091]|nr:hypothetical protein [Rhodobacterales bacterium HKCCE2091]